MVSGEVRPKLKQDAVFFQGTDGVLLKSEQTTFFLRGKTVYTWLSKLSPHMTGEHTLDQICEGLDDGRRETVVKLVESLIERGVVKNRILEDPALLPREVREHFRVQIEFIDHYADEALAKFKRFREAKVLAAGFGGALSSLAEGLVRNGLAHVQVAPTGPIDLKIIEDQVAALANAGIETELTVHSPNVLVDGLGDFDLITYCADASDLSTLRELNARCTQGFHRFLPATVFAEKTMIGPLVEPGKRGCWLCAMLRRSTNLDSARRADLWRRVALDHPLAGLSALNNPSARLMGNALAFEIFKILGTHLTPESRGGVLLQDVELFEAYVAELVPHPLCQVCSRTDRRPALDRLEQLISGQNNRKLEPEDLFRRLDRVRDFNLGILRRFDDEDLPQLPLKTTRLVVGHPWRAEASDWTIVTFSSENVLQARCQAMAEAVLRYCRAIPDTRAMVKASYNELQASGAVPIAGECLLAWNGLRIETGAKIPWLPAWSLTADEKRYVPAAAVYPETELNQGGVFEAAERGSGVGLSFEKLKIRALVAALGEEQLAQAGTPGTSLVDIDPASLATASPDLAYLFTSLQRFGAGLSLLLVESDWPVQVVVAAADLDGKTEAWVSVGFGLSRSEAVVGALTQLLGTIELHNEVESLSNAQAERAREILASGSNGGWRREVFAEQAGTWDQAITFLKNHRLEALFVSLTSEDIQETETYLSGMVLLARS